MIRNYLHTDLESITAIYNYHILYSIATFEEEIIGTAEMQDRIKQKSEKIGIPWIVYEAEDSVLGYAYAAEWNPRSAYRKTAETSIYLDSKATGKGIGTQLYTSILETLKKRGFHTAIGGISLPNPPSERLHEKLGFHKVAHFKEVGYKFDNWIDVGYWQLKLNP